MSVFKHYLVVCAISFLPLLIVVFSPSLFHTHDGLVHLPRMAAYYKAITSGQILPRWASDLNYGYGMPLFNFIYHTPYLISALFIRFGLSLANSFKIVMIISYLLSGIAMFAFTHYLFGDTKKAFLVTIFYQFAPFRLVELLVRGSFGEMYTYAFLPIVLYGLLKIVKKPSVPNIVGAGIAAGLLIISHNSISLVFFGVAELFILFFFHKKNIFYGIGSLILGLLISAFYWLPALLEHKYTLGDLYMRDIFREHFPPLINFFIPNFLNSPQLQTKGISVQFGIFHVGAIIVALYILLARKKIDPQIKKLFLFSFVLIIGSLFLMQPVSTIVWEKISWLRQFQFPWRLLSVTSLATAFLSVSFFSFSIFKNKKVYYLVILGVIFSTIFYWNPPLGFDKIRDEGQFWNFPLTTTYWGETDVIWSAGPAKSYAKEQMEPIEGDVRISNMIKKSIVHTATVQSTSGGKIVDNTEYFPGWKAYVNDSQTPIQFQDTNWRGLITFSVPAGTTNVKIVFEKSPTQKLGEYISEITLLTIFVASFTYIWKRRI